MNYLSIEELTKSYGIKVLFENISFGIDQGQKVALVAKNGTGKSSLLKIIAGLDTPDSGKVTLRKEIKLSFLKQEHEHDDTQTVLEAVFSSDKPELKAIKRYEACMLTPDHPDTEAAFEEMTDLQAWEYEVKVKQILSQLKMDNLQQLVSELSGGQKKRLSLAKILIDEPDIMLLDEPTNHLDLDMLEWLEDYLERQKVTLLMVTHDRYFLERVCTDILELDQGLLYRYKGNYSYYIEKKAEREANEQTNITKAKNLMRKELAWMRKMPKARGTKSKSRIDAFYDLKDVAGKKIKKDELALDVKMERLGSKILELHKVGKSFGDLKMLNNFSYVFKRKERIGIVGKNGVGKSTFLNMITGKLEADNGKIVTGDTVKFGYYTQAGIKLKEDKRVIEVVKDIAEVIPVAGGRKLTAAQFLERFLFDKDIQWNYVSTLSGGERRRLYLLTVLMENPNFLILDEPTNDLDIFTLNVLEEYLMNFDGCLIVVSHDRYFMDKIVDHIFVFKGEGEIKSIIGNYSAFREDQKLEKQQTKQKKKVEKPIPVAEKSTEKVKLTFKEKFEFEQLEKDIELLEKEKAELVEKMNSGTDNHEELMEVSDRMTIVVKELDTKSDRWLELSEYA
jgi:ATP-binding cassette subfamily F protein uup